MRIGYDVKFSGLRTDEIRVDENIKKLKLGFDNNILAIWYKRKVSRF
ncbi:MAG: hypothetical protein LBQ13_02800 [Endomicrobium sp.]|jgi:hypothetical protein|nr:hypothetical protein [Endomicrobium sp.]